jgi:cytochrome c peroxidase
VSCASCHDPAFAFSGKGLAFNTGVNGVVGSFNSPALINLGWTSADPYRFPFEDEHFSLFWDGRVDSLENQARVPVASPSEMNLPWAEAEAKVQAEPLYPGLFRAAFGDESVTEDRIVKALAQFQRTLRSYNSKWDRLQRGELNEGEVWTEDEILGFSLFTGEQGDCFHCHGVNLALFINNSSSGLFNNNGLDSIPDPGLMASTGEAQHEGKFRVPTLRNIEYTAPYMHDGRFATLDEVLQHYSEGVATDSPNLDSNLKARAENNSFTPEQIEALKAFLRMLSDPGFLTEPDFQDPFPD